MGVNGRGPALAGLVVLGGLALAMPGASVAQMRPTGHAPPRAMAVRAVAADWSIAGTWVYRSYLNRPDVIVNDDSQSAAKALALLFGEGIMTLRTPTPTTVVGTFDMGGGYVLDLRGTIAIAGGRTSIHIIGPGRPNTPTAGWEYDYDAVLAEKWPRGVNQIPALVGSVFRAKPHGSAPAGVVASFMAVKKS